MELWVCALLAAAALVVGLLVGVILRKVVGERKIKSAETEAKKIKEDAVKEAESMKKADLT